MQTVFFFKNMLPGEQEKLQEYCSVKLPSLEKMLSHFPPDGVILQVKGEKFRKHSAFEVEFVMKLANRTFSAKEASHMITKAVDLAKDRLVMQLKKSVYQIRRTHRSVKARSKVKMRSSAQV